MSDDFEINESGEIVVEKLSGSFAPDLRVYIQSKSSNSTYSNHQKQTADAFEKAKENIKRRIIAADKSGKRSRPSW